MIFSCPLPSLLNGSGKLLEEIWCVSGITLNSEICYQGRSVLILSPHVPYKCEGYSGLIQGLLSHSAQLSDLACSRVSRSLLLASFCTFILLPSGQYSGAFNTLLWEGSEAAVPSVTVLAWGDCKKSLTTESPFLCHRQRPSQRNSAVRT